MLNESIRNGTVSVGTSVVLVSPPLLTGQRRVLTMTNTSTAGQIISISWENEAQALTGVVLYPGGSWSESIDTAFLPSNSKITAIASAASGTLAVHERVA